VKRLVAALAGIAGIAWFRRRKPAAQPAQPDPAEELKAKLAQAREVADDRDRFESGEKPVDEVPDDVDTRRSAVHDRARAAIDDLSSDS
jgi:hypothetical protein